MYGGDTLVKTDVIVLSSSFITLLQSTNESCTDQLMCAEITDKSKQSPCVLEEQSSESGENTHNKSLKTGIKRRADVTSWSLL